MSDHPHAVVLRIVHEEAGRTLSKEDFDLCIRIAKHAFGKGYAHALPLAAVDARSPAADFTPPVPVYLGRIETSDGNEAWVELSDEDRKYWRDTVRSVYLAAPETSTPAPRMLPADLTPPVRNVLSLMLWQTLPIANALRATGRHINRKTEDEQAAALHWLLGIALEHGDNWEQEAARALHKLLSEKRET